MEDGVAGDSLVKPQGEALVAEELLGPRLDQRRVVASLERRSGMRVSNSRTGLASHFYRQMSPGYKAARFRTVASITVPSKKSGLSLV